MSASITFQSISRQDHELPFVTNKLGWRYHHLGIPTRDIHPGEVYLPQFKFHVSGFNTSPFGIEWMRFDDDCPMHELIKTVPHLAFVVDDLEAELSRSGLTILTPPNSPCPGIRVAMIVHNGAPVELMEFGMSGH